MKILSWLQITIAILFAGGSFFVYTRILSDVRPTAQAASDWAEQGAGNIKEIEADLNGIRVMTEVGSRACKDLSSTLTHLNTSYGNLKTAMPAARQTISTLSVTATGINTMFVKVASLMEGITLPNGLHMDGWKPILTWFKPLTESAKGIQDIGARFETASVALRGLDSSVFAVLDRKDDPLPKSIQSSSEALLQASSVLLQFSKRIPALQNQLSSSADLLRGGRTNAYNVEQYALFALLGSWAISTLVVFQSAMNLTVVRRMNKLTIMASAHRLNCLS